LRQAAETAALVAADPEAGAVGTLGGVAARLAQPLLALAAGARLFRRTAIRATGTVIVVSGGASSGAAEAAAAVGWGGTRPARPGLADAVAAFLTNRAATVAAARA
jgi:hypothetical protein